MLALNDKIVPKKVLCKIFIEKKKKKFKSQNIHKLKIWYLTYSCFTYKCCTHKNSNIIPMIVNIEEEKEF